MSQTRRHFLQTSALLAAAASFPAIAPRASARTRLLRPSLAPPAPKHILILGGTGFLGPACTEAALARGHRVTQFNRGRLESIRKERGRPSAVPAGVDILYGNRDPDKHADDWKDAAGKSGEKSPDSPKGLSQLEGKAFDGVIDTSGYFPRIARASAALLKPAVSRYVFISTISVYPDTSKPGMDESAPTSTLADPTTEEFGADMSNYGPGKADCERAILETLAEKATVIRPGFIVGPRDTSARFMYWPLRLRRGGTVAVPGDPTDPIQIIDVRDLADFVVRTIEDNTPGTFNATGPANELSMHSFIEGVKSGVGGEPASPVHLSAEFLESQQVQVGELPLWVPSIGDSAGFHRISIARAKAAGLAFRPLADTAKATLEWFDTLPEDVKAGVSKTSVTPEREAALIKAWGEFGKK